MAAREGASGSSEEGDEANVGIGGLQKPPTADLGIGTIKGLLPRIRSAVVARWRAVGRRRERLGHAPRRRGRCAALDEGATFGPNAPDGHRPRSAAAAQARAQAEAALRRLYALRVLVGVGRVGLGPRPRRHGARAARSAERRERRRCARIFSITARSSMQAMIRSVPPQAAQRSISMPKTRRRRCAQPVAARRVRCSGSLDASECSASTAAAHLAPGTRPAGGTRARASKPSVSLLGTTNALEPSASVT